MSSHLTLDDGSVARYLFVRFLDVPRVLGRLSDACASTWEVCCCRSSPSIPRGYAHPKSLYFQYLSDTYYASALRLDDQSQMWFAYL